MCPDWAIFKCLSDKSRGLFNPSECFISGILVPYDKLKSVYDICYRVELIKIVFVQPPAY